MPAVVAAALVAALKGWRPSKLLALAPATRRGFFWQMHFLAVGLSQRQFAEVR
jgi:hypothetical protein